MDKRIVGTNAGKVWCALKEIGEISIPELARRLNLSVESTGLAGKREQNLYSTKKWIDCFIR